VAEPPGALTAASTTTTTTPTFAYAGHQHKLWRGVAYPQLGHRYGCNDCKRLCLGESWNCSACHFNVCNSCVHKTQEKLDKKKKKQQQQQQANDDDDDDIYDDMPLEKRVRAKHLKPDGFVFHGNKPQQICSIVKKGSAELLEIRLCDAFLTRKTCVITVAPSTQLTVPDIDNKIVKVLALDVESDRCECEDDMTTSMMRMAVYRRHPLCTKFSARA
jgi:hypothetical protein